MTRRISLMLTILAAMAVLLGLPQSARADIGQTLLSEYHDYSSLGVRVVGGGTYKELKPILENPEVKILILQVPYEKYDLACTAPILAWVRQGHAFWFYDSRYGPYFGMHPYPLKAEQFRGKPESGAIGSVKYNGMACVAMNLSEHPVMTGVGQCSIFLPLIGDNTYSAVDCVGDVVPLLRFANDSPALAALRRDGRGVIVFKPLLWVKSMSGERFQYNMLDYSAGYGVPGTGGDGRLGEPIGPQAEYVKGTVIAEFLEPIRQADVKNAPLQSDVKKVDQAVVEAPDVLRLTSDKVMTGFLENKSLHIETSSESVEVPLADVECFEAGDGIFHPARLKTRSGREYRGILMNENIYFRTNEGSFTFAPKNVAEIKCGLRQQ